MVSHENFDSLRNELSVKAKNGTDFILAASIIWMLIAFLWTLDFSSYNKSVLTFIVGGFMFPLALLFSKILKTNWKNKDNPLQPLGLWFNFAQLFYFPFLIFILIKMPDYFIMVYAIITGGHFFPYSWLYKTNWYAIFAGLIVVGALVLGMVLPAEKMFLLPLCMSISLIALTFLLWIDARKKANK
jgi:hypothetical protein